MYEDVRKEKAKFQLDLVDTLLSNIFWLLIMFVTVGFLLLGFGQVDAMENETNKLLWLIVFTFAFVKLLAWNGHPRLSYKERK